MNFFYKENQLQCEEVVLQELVEQFGTPLYVYSRSQLLENFSALDASLAGIDHLLCYALKANSNHYLLKHLAEAGSGADIVSGGELYLALKAGFHPDRIVFAGVGKREDEIEYALRENVFCLNAESAQELQLISLVALRLKKTARVALRINPNIDAESHPYTSTGLHHHKFGINADHALEVGTYASTLPHLQLTGIHVHIGSQITKVEPYAAAASFIVQLVQRFREKGMHITHVDIGGGFAVQYKNALAHEALPKEETTGENIPSALDCIRTMLPLLQQTECTIILEPGRSIVADAGVLLTQVLYTKENGSKKFVVVDAGMNDMLRPSLYDAYHQIVPLKIDTYEHEKVDVVGPVCETGDFFAHDRLLSKVGQKEVLALMTVGAYGMVKSSNYNGRLRPAELLVNGDRVRVIRSRQTLEQLLTM